MGVLGRAELTDYIVANIRDKTLTCTIIILLISLMLSAIIPAYALPDENYTYADATVKIARSSINGNHVFNYKAGCLNNIFINNINYYIM